jgi:hypothetical protein
MRYGMKRREKQSERCQLGLNEVKYRQLKGESRQILKETMENSKSKKEISRNDAGRLSNGYGMNDMAMEYC